MFARPCKFDIISTVFVPPISPLPVSIVILRLKSNLNRDLHHDLFSPVLKRVVTGDYV